MASMDLQVLATGRDNNFNLIRFTAASLVIVTHAYGLTGNAGIEPLSGFMGLSLGSLAVDVFFIVSGFLIAKSWDRRHDPIGYFYARFLRIYPALWASVLVCVFLLGPVFTTYPLSRYFFHIDTLKFLLENATLLLKGTFHLLPGVFEGNPSRSVNNPLWTLPYELKMYIGLALLGWLGILARRWLVLCMVLGFFAGFAIAWLKISAGAAEWVEMLRFCFLFFSGTALYLCRDRIRLSWAWIFMICVALALSLAVLDEPDHRRLVLALFSPWLTISLAFVPGGWIRGFNRLGDYSYGIYILGMPIQQSVIAVTGMTDPVPLFAVSYAITLAAAIASWHVLESRALLLPLPRMLRRVKSLLDSRKSAS